MSSQPCINFRTVDRKCDYVESFRGSIFTTLPLRSTAILFPARRCLSTAFITASLAALSIALSFEDVLDTLRGRERFLEPAFPYLNEFFPNIGGCDDLNIRRMLTSF